MTEDEFRWQRPKLMGMSDFREFVSEVELLVGVENISLLKDINSAMNGGNVQYSVLEMSKDDIQEIVAASSVDKIKFQYYLSFLHEIEYRKSKGMALLGRKRQIVPSHHCLPPTNYQIHRKLLPIFNALTKTWNISLIVVVLGAVPFMIVPLSRFVSHICGIGTASDMENSISSVVAFTVWTFFLVVFAVTFSLARIMRRRKC